MIIGFIAMLLNMFVITVISALIVIPAVVLATKYKPNFLNNDSAGSRRRTLWMVALLPWIVGLIVGIVAIGFDTPFFANSTIGTDFRWHHSRLFNIGSWHGLTLVLALMSIAVVLGKKIIRLPKEFSKLRFLRSLSSSTFDQFRQLDSDVPMAMTVGFLRPKCYISSALSENLTDDELEMVKAHEKEHARRRDPLKKWLFGLCTSFYPKNTAKLLNQAMVIAIEQGADSVISAPVSDKSSIAMTLLKVRRLTVKQNILDNSVVCYCGIDALEARISYLLDTPRTDTPLHTLKIALLATSMFVICLISSDLIHHTIELILSH